jgi:hypothetical protein
MKRLELLRKISRAAKRCEVDFELVRQGKEHEYWLCGGFRFAVPRHREIAEGTAEAICRDLEPVLGDKWWRR